jgi:hypothetical protein
VLRIERGILRDLVPEQRKVLAVAARLVTERLAPLDAEAAAIFLDELRYGDIPLNTLLGGKKSRGKEAAH